MLVAIYFVLLGYNQLYDCIYSYNNDMCLLLDAVADLCCPQIILQPPESSFYTLPGYQAYVEDIPDYGNCIGNHNQL